MICRRCLTVMGSGTRYEKKKGHDSPYYKRYFECKKCHDRVYTNAPNFQECMSKASEKCRNKKYINQ